MAETESTITVVASAEDDDKVHTYPLLNYVSPDEQDCIKSVLAMPAMRSARFDCHQIHYI
jgi:hypothetical protein